MARQISTRGNLIFTLLRLFKGEDILIVGLAVFLAGLAAISAWWPNYRLSILLIACIFCMLGVAGVNAMNQIHDLKIDRINKPLRPLPAAVMTKKQVRFIASSLFCLGAVLGIILWFLVSPIYLIIGVLGLSTALMYSIPSIRIKKYPIISTALMGFGYGPFLFIAGWVVYKPIEIIPIWVLVFLYFHETFILITKDYRDFEGDKRYEIKTLPIILGKQKAAILNYVLYVIPFLFFWLLGVFKILNYDFNLLILFGVLIGIPMFACCAQESVKMNVEGYYIYIAAFILVRIIIVLMLM